MTERFWEHKKLHQLSHDEWEALCDGCGKCCLHKLIDSDDRASTVHFTDVSCRLLDVNQARCMNYPQRQRLVPDCVVITPANVHALDYMPTSCAYRRLAEGRGLASWHPLLHDGSRAAMIAAGMSAAGRVVSEDDLADDLEERIVTWPLTDTK